MTTITRASRIGLPLNPTLSSYLPKLLTFLGKIKSSINTENSSWRVKLDEFQPYRGKDRNELLLAVRYEKFCFGPGHHIDELIALGKIERTLNSSLLKQLRTNFRRLTIEDVTTKFPRGKDANYLVGDEKGIKEYHTIFSVKI